MAHNNSSSVRQALNVYTAALRIREFRLYLFGQTVSLFGGGLQAVALPWLIYRTTGSAVTLSLLATISVFVFFCFVYVGGIHADKYDRRKYLILIESICLIQAVCLSVLTLFRANTMIFLVPLFALSAVSNLMGALETPGRNAFTQDLVGKENLVRGRAMFGAVYWGSLALGSATAGFLTSMFDNGEAICFFINAITFMISISVLLNIRVPKVADKPNACPSNSPDKDVTSAWRCAFTNKAICFTFVQTIVLAFFAKRMYPLLPIFAQDVLEAGAMGNGILATGWAIGQVMGMFSPIVFAKPNKLTRIVSMTLLFLPLTIELFVSADGLMSAFIGTVVTSTLFHAHVGMCQIILQFAAPAHLQGRMFAIRGMVVGGTEFIASILAGVAAEKFGATNTVQICVVCTLVCAVLTFRGKELSED